MNFKKINSSEQNIYESDAFDILSKIKELLEINIDLEVKDTKDIINFLNEPSIFLDDEKLIKDIDNLNQLIKLIGEHYYE